MLPPTLAPSPLGAHAGRPDPRRDPYGGHWAGFVAGGGACCGGCCVTWSRLAGETGGGGSPGSVAAATEDGGCWFATRSDGADAIPPLPPWARWLLAEVRCGAGARAAAKALAALAEDWCSCASKKCRRCCHGSSHLANAVPSKLGGCAAAAAAGGADFGTAAGVVEPVGGTRSLARLPLLLLWMDVERHRRAWSSFTGSSGGGVPCSASTVATCCWVVAVRAPSDGSVCGISALVRARSSRACKKTCRNLGASIHSVDDSRFTAA